RMVNACITGGPQCMPMHRAVPGGAQQPRPTESITAGQSAPRGWPVPPTHSRTSRHSEIFTAFFHRRPQGCIYALPVGGFADVLKGGAVMAGKKQLPPVRVVQEGETAPPSTVAATLGNRLDELRALRRIMAAHIDSPKTLARDLAALSRQFRDVSAEIEELEAIEAEAGVGVDDGGSSEDSAFRLEAI